MALEVCVDSAESALSAFAGGARRLELCSCLALGGLTPSLGMFRTVRKLVPRECPIFVMIRPRQGERYVYGGHDVEAMAEDIRVFKESGADGFVFGCLTESREVDEEACRVLLGAAEGSACTFHRAFDVVREPEEALRTLVELGFSRVLTSGQEENAFLGRHLIRKLVVKAKELGSSLVIVAGGGVSPLNLKEILETTQVKEYHGSARSDSGSSKEGIYVTDQLVVREMVRIGQSVSW